MCKGCMSSVSEQSVPSAVKINPNNTDGERLHMPVKPIVISVTRLGVPISNESVSLHEVCKHSTNNHKKDAGDMVGALPIELARRGHRVMTIAPR